MAMTAIEWNYAKLQEHLWNRLGAQKRLAGRECVDRATQRLVTNWPCNLDDAETRTVALRELRQQVCEALKSYDGRDRRYGFFWTLILSALISQLIRLLLEWWLDSKDNQHALQMMKVARLKRASDEA